MGTLGFIGYGLAAVVVGITAGGGVYWLVYAAVTAARRAWSRVRLIPRHDR